MSVAEHPLSSTAGSLAIDITCASVVGALGREGIESVVLKGPSFASWLYGDGGKRPYGDADLLVPPDRLEDAERLLRSHGFRYGGTWSNRDPRLPDGLPWKRGAIDVDLHDRIPSIGAPPDEAWRVLTASLDTMRVGGRPVKVLAVPARAMHVALHAVQHGRASSKPLEDLRRAVEMLSIDSWRAALDLARRLESEPAFAMGLSMLREGLELARTLGVVAQPTSALVLAASSARSNSLAFEELSAQHGIRNTARALRAKAVPSPTFMRWWLPLARRGLLGLALSYLVRWAWMAWRVVPGYRYWRAARRAAS